MTNNEDQEGDALPYFVPNPIDADDAHDILFPTSPLNEKLDPHNEEILLPTGAKPDQEKRAPLMDD